MRWLAILGLSIALGAVAAAESGSQPPTPRAGELSDPQQGPAAAAKNEASKQNQGTQQNPVFIKVIPPEKTEAERTQETTKENEKSSLDRRLVKLTGSLSVYTGLLFLSLIHI